jgi:hypothetical protein
MTPANYRQQVRALLSPAERRVFQKLSTPQKIQDYLDHSPINFELAGETILSPRQVLHLKTMHCAEGALFAAAALVYHGLPPLLMDFQTLPSDEDHVITLFKQNDLWGAISKTNHAILKWRDPIYKSPRELAMSYAHEYYLWSGKKSLLAYSKPYDLRRYKPEDWVTADFKKVERVIEELDMSPHLPIAPKKVLKNLRPASKLEIKNLKNVEWKDPRKRA